MASNDDYPWAYYARLQNHSSKLTRLTPFWWGMEAGMAYLLDALTAGTVPADPAELMATLNRTIASAVRLHRSRSAALASNVLPDEPFIAGDTAAEARLEIRRILRVVSSKDEGILIDAGLGLTDREIADRYSSTPGAVRVRISRLRLKIAA
jgi:DNA-binding NarL/FixJ family response regulator